MGSQLANRELRVCLGKRGCCWRGCMAAGQRLDRANRRRIVAGDCKEISSPFELQILLQSMLKINDASQEARLPAACSTIAQISAVMGPTSASLYF